MSKQNGVSLPFLLLLVLMSICSPTVMAFESSLEERIFKRPDPLRGLKNYRGAYNITDKHYLASAAFTGVHSYVIALLWLLCGLCFGVFVLFKKKSNNETSSFRDFMDHQHIFIFLLIIIFTILAVIAAGFVLAANESSMHRIRKFKSTIVKAGRQTHRSLYKVILATTDMQVLLRPYDPATSLKLYNITHRLARDSKSIQNFVQKTVHAIDLVIQISHTSHLVVVAIDLVLLGASLVLLLLHWHPGFLIIIFICWILTTLFWALAGIDFFLHIFVDDTCIAFHEYDQLQNSSMSSLLPCVDPAYSDKILTDIGKTVHDYVSQLKSKAVEFYGSLGLKEQNSDILGLNRICDPFSGAPDYTYTPELCPDESITIDQLSKILSDLTCFKGNSTETCTTEGRLIPQSLHDVAWAYGRSVQDMIDIFPEVKSLTKCAIVKKAFADIDEHQCKPFRASVRMLWESMLGLSIFMVVLVLTWVAKAYQESNRNFSRCSISPNPR